jgi:hypothetical protein
MITEHLYLILDNKWYQYLDEVPLEKVQELLKDLEKSEDYEACDKLKAYIDSRVRDNKLKEILD